jgi:hypothetical protein
MLRHFKWFVPREQIWEPREIIMPKIIRFSSSFCTLFHKRVSHYLPNTRSSRTKPKQQANTTLRGKFIPQNYMSKCHNFIPKSQSQHHIKTSQNSSKKWTKSKTKTHILLERILAWNHIPKDRFTGPRLLQEKVYKDLDNF